ncbi:MAG: hypothetical protein ABI840_04470 [bacterium]
MTKEFFNSIPFNLLLTLIFGIIISYVDLHSDEVQPAVLMLIIFSCILGYKHPSKAWLYSLLLGLSIITSLLFSKLIGFKPVGPAPDNIFSSLLAILPALVGGYSGVLLRAIFKKTMSA